ncbi:MAG: hypothetical protein ABI199_08810 [Bacteroidia bacterium]
MKKISAFVIFFFTVISAFAGYHSNHGDLDKKHKKYFVAVGYGIGTAKWYSRFQNTNLLSTDGSVIETGNTTFQTQNPTNFYNFEVSFPVQRVRLGLGISFESFYLDKLYFTSPSTIASNYIVFDDNIRFDKFYGMIEIPFKPESNQPYSFSFIGRLGYYGYNGLAHLGFFGQNALASTYLANIAFLADYELFTQTYLYVSPCLEFKYFRNNKNEVPSIIVHDIYTAGIVFGIRVDLGKK